MSKIRFLVSGGTGFLGAHVCPKLKEIGSVIKLSRSHPSAVQADLSIWDGGLDPKKLRGRFDVFLHLAGLYDLRITELEGLRQNVMTTHTALSIAQKAEIPCFVHASTVAVTLGQGMNYIMPDELDPTVKYPDSYAYSKAFAESMVKHWADGVESRLVLRLGVLVGDSQEGRINRIDGPYHAAETVTRFKTLLAKWPGPIPLPGRHGNRLPLVPVDAAAGAIARLCQLMVEKQWKGYKALHLTPKHGLSAHGLYSTVLRHCGLDEKDFTLTRNLPSVITKGLAETLAGFPKEEVEYLLHLPKFDTSETRQLLGEHWCPEFEDYEQNFWKGYRSYVQNR